jgi:hypothetical protein
MEMVRAVIGVCLETAWALAVSVAGGQLLSLGDETTRRRSGSDQTSADSRTGRTWEQKPRKPGSGGEGRWLMRASGTWTLQMYSLSFAVGPSGGRPSAGYVILSLSTVTMPAAGLRSTAASIRGDVVPWCWTW